MDTAEYIEQNIRVGKYKGLINRRDKLTEQKNRVSNGILSITAAYQNVIVPAECGEDFEQLLIETLVNMYDREIENIEVEMSVI
ncbi:hypothetical protein K413DRAFT_4635 [Clostridium sp. ASBs410]|nr:hypothetical protein K413DRAFT_4635 [Clostridium sp. ASBs410]